MLPRLPSSIITLAVLATCIGCESVPKSGSLDDALADYYGGRFALAHQRAVEAMRGASGSEREQAAYIAGLSAFQKGDLDEAELRLHFASRSSDARTAASAKTMLGQMRLARQQPREAASLFEEAAAGGLAPADAREAARYASIAHQRAGNDAQAERWHAHTRTTGTGAAHTMLAAGEAGRPGGGFTIQVGAFHGRPRAALAAEDATSLARQHGLSQARIIERSDSRGHTLYVVQLGSFATRTAAEQARTRIGRQEFIVATQ
jgi:hypothetical protein